MAINVDGIKAQHVVRAAALWRKAPGYGGFRESTLYDILVDGKPYPPKAIAAIACELAGLQPPAPSEFKGAWDGPWHRTLKSLGFDIVPKVGGLGSSGSVAPTNAAAQIEADLRAIEREHADKPTVCEALIKARLGQGKFRREVLARWGHRCAVTGCAVPQVLRASHAKPWRESSDDERLDPDNGLPLIATLDALFDSGLISFDATGQMEISPQLDAIQRASLLTHVPHALAKPPGDRLAGYLAAHSRMVFRNGKTSGNKKLTRQSTSRKLRKTA
ncbi:HNH endonuclease [Ralstonia pseudosolanacearum]|uniref:HNH endonuclease n=1 Tax=Ralstonia pseudosolanacearum TaxID=1310165 RepID=UPI003C14BFF4